MTVNKHPYFQPVEGALPPDEVRFIDIRTEPWPDGRRIRVLITITPFEYPPNLEITVLDSDQVEVCNIHIIETIEQRLVFTAHLRGKERMDGKFILTAFLSYPEIGIVDQSNFEFETYENLEE
jgi:hypothetical protein